MSHELGAVLPCRDVAHHGPQIHVFDPPNPCGEASIVVRCCVVTQYHAAVPVAPKMLVASGLKHKMVAHSQPGCGGPHMCELRCSCSASFSLSGQNIALMSELLQVIREILPSCLVIASNEKSISEGGSNAQTS